ncbi:apolipoprotein L1 isoform X3 [Piliocolobus tephrosceles]|uniref:apolipoprotein L1 isoform X3 n=1 Tax=Piliocolobus tephrosceles TaxID=591936 RepID=UPI000E6B29BE|nr:apolipoprotein L1 isoform X3 [Piliocolobus tephrosceles]
MRHMTSGLFLAVGVRAEEAAARWFTCDPTIGFLLLKGATKRSKWDRYRRSSRLTIDPPNAISEWSNQNGDCRLKSRDPGSRWRASSWAFDNGGF